MSEGKVFVCLCFSLLFPVVKAFFFTPELKGFWGVVAKEKKQKKNKK